MDVFKFWGGFEGARPRVEPGAATGACACGFGVKTHANQTMQPTTLTNARLSPQSPVTYPNHPA